MKDIAETAAGEGDIGAMGRLGRMYRDGKGVEKDLDKAIEWMRKAAERNPNWKNEFMYMLWKRGTLEDLRELNGNAEKGAAEGNAFALQWLGRMYRDGKGVEKDLDKAIDMMRKTAEKIQGWSRNELIDMLWKRGTPEDFAEMKDIAETAAGEGDIGAMSRLGRMYRDGKGVEKDLDKAIEWMRKAAESGNKWTVIEYVDTLWKRSSFQDLKRAIAILTPLGEREDAEAMERLGIAYRDGKGVEKNLDVAIKWMSKATITLPRLKNSLNEMLSTPSSYQDKNEPHNNH